MIAEFSSFAAEPPETGPQWICTGLLAARYLTLLTGLWKSGKTTLLAMLLGRRRSAMPLVQSK